MLKSLRCVNIKLKVWRVRNKHFQKRENNREPFCIWDQEENEQIGEEAVDLFGEECSDGERALSRNISKVRFSMVDVVGEVFVPTFLETLHSGQFDAEY